jgi:hypothetical protein
MHAEGSEAVDRGGNLVLPGPREAPGVVALSVKRIERIEALTVHEVFHER